MTLTERSTDQEVVQAVMDLNHQIRALAMRVGTPAVAVPTADFVRSLSLHRLHAVIKTAIKEFQEDRRLAR